jgi:Flp pilus assembly protein TadG
MTKRWRRKPSSRRGAAIVEFAFCVPVFLTLVVGMVELSRAIVVLQVLTNASREGARIASYDTTSTTGPITTAVNNYLTSEGISGATTVVSPSPASLADGQQISVTVSISYNTVSWLPSSFYLGGQTLQATTTMCREPAL